MEVLKLVKKMRKDGKSYEAIAAELGVSWRTVYGWVKEERKPSRMAENQIKSRLSTCGK